MSVKQGILNSYGCLFITSRLSAVHTSSDDVITGASGRLIPDYLKSFIYFLVDSDIPIALAVK